jgi:hypothetical protein
VNDRGPDGNVSGFEGQARLCESGLHESRIWVHGHASMAWSGVRDEGLRGGSLPGRGVVRLRGTDMRALRVALSAAVTHDLLW